jgi:hypothetical protein
MMMKNNKSLAQNISVSGVRFFCELQCRAKIQHILHAHHTTYRITADARGGQWYGRTGMSWWPHNLQYNNICRADERWEMMGNGS